MTTAVFARLETRVNGAVIRHIANDQANGLGTFGQSVSFPVIFDAPPGVANVGAYGMATSQPSVTTPTENVIEDWSGWELTIKGKTYAVVAHEPDGTGLSRLVLEVVR